MSPTEGRAEQQTNNLNSSFASKKTWLIFSWLKKYFLKEWIKLQGSDRNTSKVLSWIGLNIYNKQIDILLLGCYTKFQCS